MSRGMWHVALCMHNTHPRLTTLGCIATQQLGFSYSGRLLILVEQADFIDADSIELLRDVSWSGGPPQASCPPSCHLTHSPTHALQIHAASLAEYDVAILLWTVLRTQVSQHPHPLVVTRLSSHY